MKFGAWLRFALLAPGAVALACYLYLIGLFSGQFGPHDPGLWFLALPVIAGLASISSAFLALRLLFRMPEARSIGNVAYTVAGLLFLVPVLFVAAIICALYLRLM